MPLQFRHSVKTLWMNELMWEVSEAQWKGLAENAIVLKLVQRKTQGNTVMRVRGLGFVWWLKMRDMVGFAGFKLLIRIVEYG